MNNEKKVQLQTRWPIEGGEKLGEGFEMSESNAVTYPVSALETKGTLFWRGPGSHREIRQHLSTLEKVCAVPNWPHWPPVLYTGPSLVLCQSAVTNPGGVPHFISS